MEWFHKPHASTEHSFRVGQLAEKPEGEKGFVEKNTTFIHNRFYINIFKLSTCSK
jgi:hypothetical protein